MHLPKGIGRNSGDESQGVAVIMRSRIGDIDQLRRAEFFFGRDLRRVDGGHRFHHVHHFARLLLMSESYVEVGSDSHLHIGLRYRVEADLFHEKFVSSMR